MLRRLVLAVAVAVAVVPSAYAAGHSGDAKLDSELRRRAHDVLAGHSRVILQLTPGVSADDVVRSVRGKLGRRLALVGGQVAYVPNASLDGLAALPGIRSVSLDRAVHGSLERTGATIGSTWVRETLGLDGSGVTVAIIDSGVTNWHDDLGSGKVVRFVDFVNFQSTPYDDYGHGTHVAGIIAGNGHDSGGRRSGIAPGASLVVEKVLDATGQGYISNVIAAVDYAIANKDALHIRIINLSVAAGVYESYTTDPLTLAAKRAVEAGIVVVSAAGNLGKDRFGQTQYGAIGAPGNAPWVITVGASSHNGTIDRSDDTVATFSSRGPTAMDFLAKPDIIAPGVGIESLADAGSTLFAAKPTARLWGTVSTVTEPYLSLSGTSMASPVISGTIALMLQADPALTPNLVKAVLQYTAENKAGVDPFAQGAGFLNARGAVELVRTLSTGQSLAQSAEADPTPWSGHITWGNQRIGHGALFAQANAWREDVIWGSAFTPQGKHVTWGAACDSDCENIVWRTKSSDAQPAVGGSGDGENIVWGTSSDGENIVWGTAADSQNIVWGTDCGGADCENIVWGTTTNDDGENIVWGTAVDGENIVWGTSTADDAERIVWGSNAIDDSENILWSAR
jgi:serine protease AprX